MINCNGISKSFKSDFWAPANTVLKNVSFELGKGRVVGFLGANGAGKTTTIKIIMSFISSDRGEVVFSDDLGSNYEEIRNSIGYLPEQPYFYPHLNGVEFISYLLELNDLKMSDFHNKVEELAILLKIDHALNRPLRSYSKGMLQRIGFLTAIIHEPKLIILDEPLSGVDPVGRSIIKKKIKELAKEGRTIFLSSHIVSDLEEVCDDVIFINQGEVVYSGEKEGLVSNDDDQYILEYYNETGELVYKKLSSENVNVELEKLIKDKCKIHRLNRDTLSLEDAVYKSDLT